MAFLCRWMNEILANSSFFPLIRPSMSSSRAYRAFTGIDLPSIPKPKTADHEKPMYRVYQMLKQRNPRVLVDEFKEFSKNPWFRRQKRIYFLAAQRLAALKQFTWIQEIVEEQKKYKSITTESFVVRMLCLYGKSGMFDHALKLFDEMPKLNCRPTVHSYNALLSACLHSRSFDKFESLFCEVPRKLGIKPDRVSYNTRVKAFCEMGHLDSGLAAVDEMEKNGEQPDSITFNLMLDGFYQGGRFSDGENVWKLMEKKGVAPSIWSYNARLRGLISEDRMPEAVELFDRLGPKRVQPDACTFCILIKGFCDDGDVVKAKEWYTKLTKTGLAPGRTVFGWLLRLSCEAGDFGWGLELCNEAIARGYVVEEVLLQRTVDGLVKESKVEDARKLVELVRRLDGYIDYELKLE